MTPTVDSMITGASAPLPGIPAAAEPSARPGGLPRGVARLREGLLRHVGRASAEILKAAASAGVGPAGRTIGMDHPVARTLVTEAHVLAPARQIRLTPPDIAALEGPEIAEAWLTAFDYETFPHVWFAVVDARVALPHCVAACGRWHLTQTFLADHALLNPKYAGAGLRARLGRAAPHGPAIILGMPWHHNFYHFIIEVMPRLQIVERDPALDGLPIVMPAECAAFARALLSRTPLADRIVYLPRGTYRFERAVFLAPLSTSCLPSPDAVSWLRRTFAGPSTASEPRGPDRLFITRDDALTRFAVNGPEIAAVARAHGYLPVAMADLPIPERIRLLAGAGRVVGLHGANMTMTVFCRPGAVLGEIVERGPVGVRAPSFFAMARHNGLRYGWMTAEPRGNGTHVDPRRLDRFLQELETLATDGPRTLPQSPVPPPATGEPD